MRFTRLALIAAAGGAFVAALVACAGTAPAAQQSAERIVVPARATSYSAAPVGLRALSLASGRDGQLYVPTSYDPTRETPLVILLHGAGQSSDEWFGSWGPRATR